MCLKWLNDTQKDTHFDAFSYCSKYLYDNRNMPMYPLESDLKADSFVIETRNKRV